jgi:phosphoenolpyruvate synthase/pyruvate phosphate dikinase
MRVIITFQYVAEVERVNPAVAEGVEDVEFLADLQDSLVDHLNDLIDTTQETSDEKFEFIAREFLVANARKEGDPE